MVFLLIQMSPLTVTPSGQGKSVTVSKCHCNQMVFINKLRIMKCKTVTVTSVTVSGKI